MHVRGPFGARDRRASAPDQARIGSSDLLVLESCNSTWVFDLPHHRFRRVLKGLDLGAREASTDWRAYHALEIDEQTGRFVVVLNPERSRLIRSHRHLDRCADCGGDVTSEFSPDELQVLLEA